MRPQKCGICGIIKSMILINNESLPLQSLAFPILINGADKTGASFFSVELLAEFYLSGQNILFFSGYEMAKLTFKQRVGNAFNENRITILEDSNEGQLLKAIETMPDIANHIIYIKNFDLYKTETIREVLQLPRLLFMGNIEIAKSKSEVILHPWKTKISFGLENIEKYYGVIESKNLSGLIHISS
ncbi:MAG: hypothetical protein UZ22_OP11002000124 [Microgenomates bacterium OLB23]|nr:MAG: hypothetical protein UZ22_OP11002000124 [Microgenomates bacterium OLB23]